MKKLTWLLLTLSMPVVFLASCSKTANLAPDTAASGVLAAPDAKRGTMGILQEPPDTFLIKSHLCNGSWYYYEVFGDFYSKDSKLLFKRDRTTNALALSTTQLTYNYSTNTFTEYTNGVLVQGRFILTIVSDETHDGLDVQITNIIVSPKEFAGYTNAEMLQMKSDKYVWYDPYSRRYGVMYHAATLPANGPGTVTARLTSTSWKYLSYFGNYTSATADMLYRLNRPGYVTPVVELADDWITYFPNGTFSTYHPYAGYTDYGNWWLTDNDTKLHTRLNPPSSNTQEYVSDITILSTSMFSWTTSGTSLYSGELIPLTADF